MAVGGRGEVWTRTPNCSPQDHVSHTAAVEGAHALVVAVAQRGGGPNVQVLPHQRDGQPCVQQINGDAAELQEARVGGGEWLSGSAGRERDCWHKRQCSVLPAR